MNLFSSFNLFSFFTPQYGGFRTFYRTKRIFAFSFCFICHLSYLTSVSQAQSGYWTQMAPNTASGIRERAVGIAIGNYGYIGTGQDANSGTFYQGWWQYNPSNNSWTQKANFGGVARDRATGFSLGGFGYVGSGEDNNGNPLNDWWRYSPGPNSWTSIAPLPNPARYSAVGFAIGSYGYVGTGTPDGSLTFFKDFWQYDPVGNTWTQKTNFGSSARFSAVGFSIGSFGYIGTGWNNGPRSDFWQYDPATNSWSQKANVPGPARAVAACFSMNGKGYVGTGYDGATNFYNDFYEYDPATDAWTQRANFAGSPRLGAVGFSVNGAGYIGTGRDTSGNNNDTKDLWKYTICNIALAKTRTDAKCSCSGTATVVASAGVSPYTYAWAPGGQTTSAVSNLCGGTYTVTVTDAANNCSSVDTVLIYQPQALSAGNASTVNICKGTSSTIGANISGGTPPYGYSWSPSTTLSCTTCQIPTASPTTTTIYAVIVTDANLCTATKTVTVNVNILPSVTANAADTIICLGHVTTLSGSGAASYLWSPSSGLSCATCQSTIAAPGSLGSITYSVTGTSSLGCTKTASVKITVIASPTVSISSNGAAICSGTSTILSAQSNGLGYTWLPSNQTTSAITVAPTTNTTYSVVTVGANGCTTSAIATITVNPKPIPTFTANINVSCNGKCDGSSKATPLAGTSPFTFSWSNSQTTQTATSLCSGSYSVTIRDANGCSASGTTTVTQPPVLTASVSSTNVGCKPCSGTATALAAGGNGSYSYSWNTVPAQTTAAITGLCTGNYIVIVSDKNGCTTTHAVTMMQAPPISVSPNQTICSGSSTTIGASAGPGNSYAWSPGNFLGDNISVSPSVTTTYTVIATNTVTACKDTGFVKVSVIKTPSLSVSQNVTICKGNSTPLTASGGNYYSWSPSNGLSNTNISNPIASPNSTITYTVTASNSPGGTCTDKKTIKVTVTNSPQVNIAATYTTICKGFSTDTLIAAGGTNYSWTSSPPSFIFQNDTILVSPDTTTIYTVTVTNGSGCSASASYTVNVTGGFNLPSASPSGASVCIGDPIPTFTATPNPSTNGIAWTDYTNSFIVFGDTFQPPQSWNQTATTYTLLCVQGTGGSCVSYATIIPIVVYPLPTANAGEDISICAGHKVNLSAAGGTNYLWSPSSYLNSVTSANPVSTPDSTISYQVMVTDSNNCKNFDSVSVYVMINDICEIQIYNIISPNGDGTNEVWWIDGINLFSDNSVDIFNRWGNKVWSGKNYDNRKVVWRGENEQGQNLPAGTYYYVIEIPGEKRHSGWVELIR